MKRNNDSIVIVFIILLSLGLYADISNTRECQVLREQIQKENNDEG